jgi:hypothetical protein
VNHELRVADEAQKFLDLVGEQRLVGEEGVGQSVHFLRRRWHRHLGI